MYKEIRAEQIADFKTSIRKLLMRKPRKLPKDFPQCYHISENTWYDWNSHLRGTAFIFRFPYDVPKRNEIIRDLQMLGWVELRRSLEKGNDVFYMGHDSYKGMWLSLRFSMSISGSTCRQVQIGMETVTRDEPIYEIVCDEGAEEEALNANH